MELTFHNSYVILFLVPCSYVLDSSVADTKTTETGLHSFSWKKDMVVITKCLIITKYLFSKWQWIFYLLTRGARGTDHPPFFSNFLFTNLFSIKFLYFFIISSLFPYFNLFVSIFIQSHFNNKFHVWPYIDTNIFRVETCKLLLTLTLTLTPTLSINNQTQLKAMN